MVETRYNMVFGMIGLLVISVFGGGSPIWLICPTPSIICFPYYLKFLTLFVELLVVGLVLKLLDLFWVINCFLYFFIMLPRFLVLCGLYLFFLLMAFLSVLWRLVIGLQRFLILVG